jgi:hypothetical protein
MKVTSTIVLVTFLFGWGYGRYPPNGTRILLDREAIIVVIPRDWQS